MVFGSCTQSNCDEELGQRRSDGVGVIGVGATPLVGQESGRNDVPTGVRCGSERLGESDA